MKAYFHNSYVLERNNISKVLAFVLEKPSANRREIAEETGIGIGKKDFHSKLLPTIRYAIYSGLLEEKSDENETDACFTNAGKIIFENDLRLKSSVTQWVMHYFLCRTENDALIWSFFIHEFLPIFTEFDYLTLRDELNRKFFQLTERNNKENQKILLTCYTDGNALSKIGLLESYEKDKYIRGNTSYPNIYLAAYILAEIWESKHADAEVVNPSVLLESGHLATTLNLNEGDLDNCLDEMSAVGVISQARAAPPFHVKRQWTDKFDLLRRAYKEE